MTKATQSVGEQIKRLRGDRVQMNVAELIGISARRLWAIEGGHDNPSTKLLIAFAETLGGEIVIRPNTPPPKKRPQSQRAGRKLKSKRAGRN